MFDSHDSVRLVRRNRNVMVASAPKMRCRQIEDGDLSGVADLLAKGFSTRDGDYWTRALTRMSWHPTPPAFPRYGYLLESAGVPVGALLLIYASVAEQGREVVRCNVSSWHVQSDFSAFAPILVSRALKYPQVTYFNVTPASRTIPILEAQGYIKYCDGCLLTAAWLSPRLSDAFVTQVAAQTPVGSASYEQALLPRHAGYGCVSLWCASEEGVFPFVFAPARMGMKRGYAPYARLVYCRSLADFVRFARPLGEFLARRGLPFVMLDSNGPISGLRAIYFRNRPKYFKGPHRPRLGDLAYTELALFDVSVSRRSRRRGEAAIEVTPPIM